jgi:hypothetical protein
VLSVGLALQGGLNRLSGASLVGVYVLFVATLIAVSLGL